MPVDIGGPVPSDTGSSVLTEVGGGGDVSLRDEGVSADMAELEFALAIVLVDEVHTVTSAARKKEMRK